MTYDDWKTRNDRDEYPEEPEGREPCPDCGADHPDEDHLPLCPERSGPWTYDLDTEELRDRAGVIGHVEPASGPLCAAAPDLLAALEEALDVAERWASGADGEDPATRRRLAGRHREGARCPRTDLLPCPFCGGEAVFDDTVNTMNKPVLFGECLTCGAKMKWEKSST